MVHVVTAELSVCVCVCARLWRVVAWWVRLLFYTKFLKKKLLAHDRLNKFDKPCDFEVNFEKRKGIGTFVRVCNRYPVV